MTKYKFPFTLMGVLDPGSAHARPSARPPINMSEKMLRHVSLKSPSNTSPDPNNSYPKFWIQRKLSNFFLKTLEKTKGAGGGHASFLG